MRWSLATSLIIHTCILLAAVVVLPSPDQYLVDEPESIPVDIVSIEEFTQQQATVKDAPKPKPEQKSAPPKAEKEPEKKIEAPKVAEKTVETVKEPAPAPQPEPAPEKIEEAKAEPQPDPIQEKIQETVAETPTAAKIPVPKLRPEKKLQDIAQRQKEKKQTQKQAKVPELDTDDLSKAIDEALNKQVEERSTEASGVEVGALQSGETANVHSTGDRDTASLAAWLRKHVYDAWSMPPGAEQEPSLYAVVAFDLDPAGYLVGQPRVVEGSFNHPVFAAFERSAMSAVRNAQPYDKALDHYEDLASNRIRFSPKDKSGLY